LQAALEDWTQRCIWSLSAANPQLGAKREIKEWRLKAAKAEKLRRNSQGRIS